MLQDEIHNLWWVDVESMYIVIMMEGGSSNDTGLAVAPETRESDYCWVRLSMYFPRGNNLEWVAALNNNHYYEGVTPAGSTQRFYIAGKSGEEERQEMREK